MATQLKNALAGKLPGFEAQLKMANAFSSTERPLVADDARDAGVLIVFYEKNGAWYFPLIQRPSNNPNDPHKGQIALPGGRYELSDSSLQATALREAREEIGIVAQDVEVLGSLTPLYIPFSGYLVHPLVGKLSYSPEFILEVAEVARVIEVPLKELLDKGLRKQKDMPITNRGSLKSVNYFELQGNVVWGATAMMLSELVSIMEQHQIVQP